MFARFRNAAQLLVGVSSVASDAGLVGNCDNNGECGATFDRFNASSQGLCDDGIALVAWNKKQGSLLLQCRMAGTAEDNRNYVVLDGQIWGLSYGRYVKVQYLLKNLNELVPDQFGPTKMCVAANENRLKIATFVLLNKHPSNTGGTYCYDPTYLVLSKGKLILYDNKDLIDEKNQNYFISKLTSDNKMYVKKLANEFRSNRFRLENH